MDPDTHTNQLDGVFWTLAWRRRLERHELLLVISVLAAGLILRIAGARPWAPTPEYLVHTTRVPTQCWYPGFQVAADMLWYLTGTRPAFYTMVHLGVITAGPAICWGLSKELGFGPIRRILTVALVSFLPYYVAVAARQPQLGWCVTSAIAALWALIRWKNRAYPLKGAVLVVVAVVVSALFRSIVICGFLSALIVLAAWERRGRARVAGVTGSVLIVLGALHAARIDITSVSPPGGTVWSRVDYCSTQLTALPGLFGYNLYLGNGPQTVPFVLQHKTAAWEGWSLARRPLPRCALDDKLNSSACLTRAAVQWIGENPAAATVGFVAKAYKFWEPVLPDMAVRPLKDNLVYSVPYLLYGGLALGSAARAIRRRDLPMVLIVAFVVGFFLPHVLFFGVTRMRMMVEFALLLLAVGWVNDSHANPLPEAMVRRMPI